jgi:hypothetical protein
MQMCEITVDSFQVMSIYMSWKYVWMHLINFSIKIQKFNF